MKFLRAASAGFSEVLNFVPRLWALARHPPRTEADLSRVDDIGPWRREAYGREILALLSGGLQPSVSTTDEVSATAGRTRPTDGSVAGESGT